jgi:hypothetical protein
MQRQIYFGVYFKSTAKYVCTAGPATGRLPQDLSEREGDMEEGLGQSAGTTGRMALSYLKHHYEFL